MHVFLCRMVGIVRLCLGLHLLELGQCLRVGCWCLRCRGRSRTRNLGGVYLSVSRYAYLRQRLGRKIAGCLSPGLLSSLGVHGLRFRFDGGGGDDCIPLQM